MVKKNININIKKFDMKSIEPNKKLIFIGKTGSGKTITLLDYLYFNQNTFPIGTVISTNEELNKSFRYHVPSIFIHLEYTSELIKEILMHQVKIKKEKNSKHLDINTNTFLVIDDCMHDAPDMEKDRSIQKIFDAGRHFDITLLMTLQYALGMKPRFRSNFQYVFLFKTTKIKEQKMLYEYYGGIFPSFLEFRTVFLRCTDNFGCMVIDNTSPSSEIGDQIFWYKVNIEERVNWNNFKLCNLDLWKNNEMYEKKLYDECDQINND